MDKLIIAPGTDPDQYYATGLGLHSPFITLCRGKKRYLAAGGFEYPQAVARFPTMKFEDLGKTRKEVIAAFCKKHKIKAPVMPASTKAASYVHVKAAKLVETLFPERAIKNANEQRAIRDATRAAEAAIAAVRDALKDARVVKGKANVTSEQLKKIAAVELARSDCSCPDMIISSGTQTALPHHTGSGAIHEGAVVVDIFPQSHETRYHGDVTRTYVIGEAPKTFDERYATVLAAHTTARTAAKAGAKNIDKKARDVFEQRDLKTDWKVGTGFIHSLGHGVGLDIHEEPRLSGTLKAGNVITIEPGYYHGYGIRIEDIGLVTKTDFQSFSKLPRTPYL